MNLKLALTKLLPDKLYLQLMYRKHFHKFINFKNPKTYNEKLQWLKLYDRNPDYVRMVDKHLVKEYVAGKIGDEHIIPTIAVYNSCEEIDFDALPDKFVLKWNHDSGSIVICKDKSKLDREAALKKLEKGEKYSGFWYGREWPYKNVEKKIIAEKLIEDSSDSDLRDYKFYCFNGKIKMLLVCSDRNTGGGEEPKFDFYDADYNRIELKRGHPNSVVLPKRPQLFEQMRELAQILSAGIPHVRVDLYEANGKVYFGELTFYPSSGFSPFEPSEYDDMLGRYIELPNLSN